MTASPMTNPERRQAVRYQVSFPVSLKVMDGALDGHAINASKGGVLLETQGRLSVQVTIDGIDYRGRLVRAEPSEQGVITYAIELEELLELPER